MARVEWDNSQPIPSGLDRGMFYAPKKEGLPWNGLISVKEDSDGKEVASYFLDGVKYESRQESQTFQGSLEAYTYPEELEPYMDSGFGLSYRTYKGQDSEEGYFIHILYEVYFPPEATTYSTSSNNHTPSLFNWKLNTLPQTVYLGSPTAHFKIDSTTTYPWMLQALEDILYGTIGNPPRLPSAKELQDLFEHYSILTITEHGDGLWSADGPDNIVNYTDTEDMFFIDWVSVIMHGPDYYSVHSH